MKPPCIFIFLKELGVAGLESIPLISKNCKSHVPCPKFNGKKVESIHDFNTSKKTNMLVVPCITDTLESSSMELLGANVREAGSYTFVCSFHQKLLPRNSSKRWGFTKDTFCNIFSQAATTRFLILDPLRA